MEIQWYPVINATHRCRQLETFTTSSFSLTTGSTAPTQSTHKYNQTHLFPPLKAFGIFLPRILNTQRVVFHLMQARVGTGHCEEELSQQKRLMEWHRRHFSLCLFTRETSNIKTWNQCTSPKHKSHSQNTFPSVERSVLSAMPDIHRSKEIQRQPQFQRSNPMCCSTSTLTKISVQIAILNTHLPVSVS